ncbi:MAG: hypothetical protein D4R82_00060 [Dehalococcoidia bacterium]|nr:MAG: hypothetical protein D4R82_00060 [Dehalococcoidia bacterium]
MKYLASVQAHHVTHTAAKNLEFEKAALLRDRIIELRKDEELLSPLTRFK